MDARLPDPAGPRGASLADVRLTVPPLSGPVACVDLETTGGMAAHHRVIEVGIVLLDDGRVVDEWSSLVAPGVRIPSSIVGFTGIDDAMVADAPPFADVAGEVRRRLDGRLFIAHNARFDYGFLRSEFRRLGERYAAPVVCTVRLSRALFPSERRHNLDALIERHELACDARHRALGDARVLPVLLQAFESRVGSLALREACTAELDHAMLPAHLPPGLADDLPETPGVYEFRGEGGVVVYVGKSGNLRSRVLAHFAAQHRQTKERRLAQLVRDVTWTETGGELGALLLESRLVKERLPTENRRLRPARGACVVALDEGAGGVAVSVEPLTAASFSPDRELYGPFRAERDARRALEGKARAAGLCLKTIGLERGEGSCFARQLGRCRGACVGVEPRALHDARLRLSLTSLRLRPWPFGSAIGIREPAPGGEGTVLHVLDRWRHLGSVADERELASLLECNSGDDGVDLDSYRILGRYLSRVSARDIVRFDGVAPR